MKQVSVCCPRWKALPCTDASVPTGRCGLAGGGNYAAMASPDSPDLAIIVHAFRQNTSKCIRCDPPDWEVAATQTVEFKLGGLASPSPAAVHVWRSCTGWEYPGAADGWFEKQADVPVKTDGTLQVEIEADCMYTFTTVGGVTKPSVPVGVPHSTAFPLPYTDNFDGMLVGAEVIPHDGQQLPLLLLAISPVSVPKTMSVERRRLSSVIRWASLKRCQRVAAGLAMCLGSSFRSATGQSATGATHSRSASLGTCSLRTSRSRLIS